MRTIPSRLLVATAAAVPALVVAAASADTTVNFTFQWKDYGNAPHPLVSDNVLFFDQNAPGPAFAGPLATNANGSVQLVTNYTNADGAGNIWIQPGLVAQINGVGTGYSDNAAITPLTYFPAGSGAYGASINQTTSYNNISFISNTDAYRALQAMQYLKVIHDFYADTTSYSAALPAIRLNYDTANVGSSMGGGTMTLGGQDWGNIDVLFHEYSHHVAEYNSLEGAPLGNQHTFDTDNISANNSGQNYGALTGSKLAWQEGIATYLGMVANNEASLSVKIPGLPGDASNYVYDQFAPPLANQTISASDFAWSVSINSLQVQIGPFVQPDPEGTFGPATPGNPPTLRRGRGEGDEMSVMRTLWDFEQNTQVEAYARGGQADYSNYGGTKIFSLMKGVPAGANKGTFYAFWQAITADVSTNTGKTKVGLTAADPAAEAVMRLGMTLEQNAISSVPGTFGEQATQDPTITWTEQNNQNSTKFEVLIYSSDWTTLVQQSPQIAAGVDAWTPANPLAPGDYEYVVLNSPVLATAGDLNNINNWYWSGDATITVAPEPASIAALLVGGVLLLRRRTYSDRRNLWN